MYELSRLIRKKEGKKVRMEEEMDIRKEKRKERKAEGEKMMQRGKNGQKVRAQAVRLYNRLQNKSLII